MKRILVIEDNQAIRENTCELLQLEGYKVLTAENGSDGFQIAVKNKPDLIICDVMMPVTDGIGFLKLIKAKKTTSHIPLIFFSADSAPPNVRKGLEQGADVYLQKPFDDSELLDTVKKLLIHKK